MVYIITGGGALKRHAWNYRRRGPSAAASGS